MKIIKLLILIVALIAICSIYYVEKAVIPNKIRESEKLVSEAKIEVEKARALISNAKIIEKELSLTTPELVADASHLNPNYSKMLKFRASYEKQLKDKINNIALKSLGAKKTSVTLTADMTGGLKEEQCSVSFVTVGIFVDEKVSDKLIGDFKQAVEKEIGLQSNKQSVTIKKMRMSFPVVY